MIDILFMGYCCIRIAEIVLLVELAYKLFKFGFKEVCEFLDKYL